ncbi:putative ribonuclease H-like domain-containing protein [Tanacetum coccineum]
MILQDFIWQEKEAYGGKLKLSEGIMIKTLRIAVTLARMLDRLAVLTLLVLLAQQLKLAFEIQKVWILIDLPLWKKAMYKGTPLWSFSLFNGCEGCLSLEMIDEEVLCHQPPGFQGFEVSSGKYTKWLKLCMGYIKLQGLLQVYVDDIIFGSTKKSWCNEFEALMKSRFQMSSMGELTFFLGLQVKQKPNVTPIENSEAFSLKDDEAICACSRFQVTPKTSHLTAVKRIFRYLKGKPKLGLWYPRESTFDLESYSDSDYAGANLDRKSTTGEAEYVDAGKLLWKVLMDSKSNVRLWVQFL